MNQPPTPDAMPDTIGRYRIEALLGEGGMGRVYRGQHTLIDRRAAIKVLKPEWAKNPTAVRRFLSEAQACVRLAHPNIVATYDVDQAGELVYLIMEFLDGEDLNDYVRRRGPVSVRAAVSFVLQAAQGLQHAHELGVIHRDVKPHNLMLTDDGVVKILDMGLARVMDEDARALMADASGSAHSSGFLQSTTAAQTMSFGEQESGSSRMTRADSWMGTLAFMAPEQAENPRRAGPTADIYALGCTLFFLLSGRPPFVRDTMLELFLAHRESPLPSLQEVRPESPPALEEVFSRMAAKKPKNRYRQISEVIADLNRIMPQLMEEDGKAPLTSPVDSSPSAATFPEFLAPEPDGTYHSSFVESRRWRFRLFRYHQSVVLYERLTALSVEQLHEIVEQIEKTSPDPRCWRDIERVRNLLESNLTG